MMSKAPSRYALPDLLKGIAVVCMIQVHIMELFATQQIYDSFFGSVSLFLGGPPAAPIFMIVMGFFALRDNKSFADLMSRGGKLLLWGFLLNIGLNFHLYVKVWNGTFDFINPLEYLFGVDILFLAGLSLMGLALFRLLLKQNLYGYLAVAMIVAAVAPFVNNVLMVENGSKYLLAYVGGTYNWSYFPIFPWLAYPLLGHAVYLVSQKLSVQLPNIKNILLFMAIAAIVVIPVFGFGFHIAAKLPAYYHHGLQFFGWTCMFLILWCGAAALLDRSVGEIFVLKYLKWLGKNVTAVYVFQWLIIGNIATAIYKTQGLGAITAWFAGILLATSLLVQGWVKIKERRVAGVPVPKRR